MLTLYYRPDANSGDGGYEVLRKDVLLCTRGVDRLYKLKHKINAPVLLDIEVSLEPIKGGLCFVFHNNWVELVSSEDSEFSLGLTIRQVWMLAIYLNVNMHDLDKEEIWILI